MKVAPPLTKRMHKHKNDLEVKFFQRFEFRMEIDFGIILHFEKKNRRKVERSGKDERESGVEGE